MLKFHKTPTCFGPQSTILREYVKPNMYAYVGDVGACIRY